MTKSNIIGINWNNNWELVIENAVALGFLMAANSLKQFKKKL